jgi:hypothetical protein
MNTSEFRTEIDSASIKIQALIDGMAYFGTIAAQGDDPETPSGITPEEVLYNLALLAREQFKKIEESVDTYCELIDPVKD